MPDENQCWFAQSILDVRREYNLTIDQREADALKQVLSGCSSNGDLVHAADGTTTRRGSSPGACVRSLLRHACGRLESRRQPERRHVSRRLGRCRTRDVLAEHDSRPRLRWPRLRNLSIMRPGRQRGTVGPDVGPRTRRRDKLRRENSLQQSIWLH